MIKSIIKVLISNGLITIVGLIITIVFPWILSTDDYATYQEYMLYLSYINICHLGIASGMFLNYAGRRYHEIDRSKYRSEIRLIFVVLTCFTIVGFCLFGVSKNMLVLYTVISIFPQCLIASFQALFQAWERFTAYSIINALPKLLFTIAVIAIWFFYNQISGETVIVCYIAVIYSIMTYFLIEYYFFTKGHSSARIFSRENFDTTKNGLLITVGNYVNLLFHSIDKQFVLSLYSTTSFALYSFAMSMQTVMMIFITALSNPFYPRLAKGDITKEYIERMKEILFVFGAYSGCAFFGVAFVVSSYIVKYVDSLIIISLFFAVFPAMAIINVLYINLYKIKRKLKKYILTLLGMLVLAILLDSFAAMLKGDYIGISFATMLCYYIWLFYSQRDFDEIKISSKDILYLIGFFIIYYGCVLTFKNYIIGFFVYGVLITVWNCLIYRKTIHITFVYFNKRFKRKGSTS